MTAEASPYPRLRRALDRKNLVEALSAASELEHVGLVEALEDTYHRWLRRTDEQLRAAFGSYDAQAV